MDNMELSTATEKDKLTQDEEDYFRRLYDQVLESRFSGREDAEEKIEAALTKILNSWRSGCGLSKIDFNEEYVAAAYIYRYGPHGAGLTRYRTLEALQNCTELQRISNKELLKVISLGGGPGNDAVGFCSALSRSNFKGELEIVVTDKFSQWEGFILKAQELLKQGGFGNASDLFQRGKVKSFEFKEVEIPAGFSKDRLLKGFDVVLICKLINNLSPNDRSRLVMALHFLHCGFVLLIDSPYKREEWENYFDCLYLSDEKERYISGSSENKRFGHDDRVESKARIAVLRNKSLSRHKKSKL